MGMIPHYADEGFTDLRRKKESQLNSWNKKKRKLWKKLYEAVSKKNRVRVEAWELKAFFEAYLRFARVFFYDWAAEVPLGLSKEEYKKILRKVSIPGLGMWCVSWPDYVEHHAGKHFYNKKRNEARAEGHYLTRESALEAIRELKEYRKRELEEYRKNDRDKKSQAGLHGDSDDGE